MLSRISGSLPNCLFLYLMGHSVLIDPRIPFDGILVLSIAASAAFPRFLRFFYCTNFPLICQAAVALVWSTTETGPYA